MLQYHKSREQFWVRKIYLKLRKYKIWFYKNILSQKIETYPIINMPTLFEGNGIIKLSKTTQFGWHLSPDYYNGYNYLEARDESSVIVIGDDSFFNNRVSIIAAGNSKIEIGHHLRVGSGVLIISSDFHGLMPDERDTPGISRDVIIKDNVFIGNNVIILKGVEIGENSVIAAGSVVTKNISKNSIAGGNPAKVIRKL